MGISSGLGRDALLPGLVLVKTVTATSGSSVDVTGVFSSTHDVYRVVFDQVKTNGTDAMTLQLLSGTTPATTTYTKQRFYAQSTTVGGSYASAQSSVIVMYTASNVEQSATMDVFDPFKSAITKFVINHVYHDGTNVSYMEQGTGSHATASSYDGFRLSCGANTFSTGNIRVYGYRN